MYIVRKYKNVFVWALETGRKEGLWQAFPTCFEVSVLLLCLSCNIKCAKQMPNYLKIAETSVVLIIFCDVSVAISFCCSTMNRVLEMLY